jgi:hypothetical protein
MKPVVHPLVHSMINTTLSFFILMMRKQQIHTARMNVNIRSQNITKNVRVILYQEKEKEEVLCPFYIPLKMYVIWTEPTTAG